MVPTASRTLRASVRSGERKRFFASCWEMVEAPRTRPRSATALAISRKSNPRWPKNPASSLAVTARTSVCGISA